MIEERGFKQTWRAERLGKSSCMVNSYICNRRQPSLEVLFEIAKILNVNHDFKFEAPDGKKRAADALDNECVQILAKHYPNNISNLHSKWTRKTN